MTLMSEGKSQACRGILIGKTGYVDQHLAAAAPDINSDSFCDAVIIDNLLGQKLINVIDIMFVKVPIEIGITERLTFLAFSSRLCGYLIWNVLGRCGDRISPPGSGCTREKPGYTDSGRRLLARIIHEASTAAADPGMSTALRSVGYRVGARLAPRTSHRTELALIAYGSSGWQVATPVTGRFTTS